MTKKEKTTREIVVKSKDERWWIPTVLAGLLLLIFAGSVVSRNFEIAFVDLTIFVILSLFNTELLFLSAVKKARITNKEQFDTKDKKLNAISLSFFGGTLFFALSLSLVSGIKYIIDNFDWEEFVVVIKLFFGPLIPVFIAVGLITAGIIFLMGMISLNKRWAGRIIGKKNVK